ncbi:hypothetical protein G3578_04255 [Brevibacillus sp. SYP-B805]|uniref:GyrI-like domain-containing protein n=1 Tax=Brevibacillus sp. SYP-B805 TaxID=1578199 RepID=UPI0013EAF9EC|nr:GyrI-like domain-containing protein [Brevibacillus sp. SYP-B805]NGQ94388.1 hypothetical protein [Brevibacillus sp. SYP-B805]
MEVTIRSQPEMHLIGLSYAGPFPTLSQGVPQIVRELQARLDEIPHKRDPLIRYELSIEDPNGTYTIYACAEVERFSRIPPGMFGFTVPALTYATVTHRGPLSEVPGTYMNMFQWLEQNGCERLTSFHSIERYHADTQANTVEIFIPVGK